jgi:hypothetical protein
VSKITFRELGSRKIAHIALVEGTVPSGHPTRTTLGNTLRVLYYKHFYLGYRVMTIDHQTPELFILVSGDDAVAWVNESAVASSCRRISALTSTVKRGIKGLG